MEYGYMTESAGQQDTPSKVLIVDDNPQNAELLQAYLEPMSYDILIAADGLEALNLQEDGAAFDLLLTDVIMPRMNGRALQVAVQARAPQTRVLFISGYTADIIEHRGALPPGSALVLKPVRPATLLRRVRDVLDA